MLRFMLLAQLIYPTIEIIDSRTDPSKMFIVINHICRVEVEKEKMHDMNYMESKVKSQCADIMYMKEDND